MMSCFCHIFRRKRTSRQQHVQFNEGIPGIESMKIYTYKELKDATDDFSPANKLGEGSFGSVYKGRLRDGKAVAVKVLSSESKQGIRQFLTEIIVVSRIIHENLVKIYGCCAEGTHRIIVYNYLENNSLARTLLGSSHSSIQFNWRTRAKICVGVARGLAFLHEEVHPHVVHRDIKASNILLDKDLTPKISDFGLAKLLPENMTHISTRVAGTIGYLAPEYAIRGQVTRKSDVYSYGVLLLEIVSGRCNSNTILSYEDQFLQEGSPNIMNGCLVLQTWALYERGELVHIIDSSLTDDLDVEEACRFLKVGLLCAQDSMKLRPSMSTVIRMLSGDEDVVSDKITKPGVIDDFMDLKVISKRTAGQVNRSSTKASLQDSPPSSSENIYVSMTFTSMSE
ncbi:serine/threonine-protein kinase isoform X1 [Canna indica]|uniref:Serine/threonine-protein kinase isoform X1 n=1 Tax=Canna indica TaxID=4628 RepID=A0AAQ3KWD1_9LILI|nr:serine/threonine-protein kinase isoform X1 [Canna indica]